MGIRKNRILRNNGARGVNFQGAGDAIDDLKRHFEIGIVRAEQGDSHFEIEDGSVWVDCVLVPTEAPVTCRLSCVAGAPGRGIWMVPAEGTEVCIAFPGGTSENGGVIIGILSTANVPEGVAGNQIVIVAPKVLVYDTDSGQANPVATKADLDATNAHIDDHFHLEATFPGTVTVAVPQFTSTPVKGTPVTPIPDPAPEAVGTKVLEAE